MSYQVVDIETTTDWKTLRLVGRYSPNVNYTLLNLPTEAISIVYDTIVTWNGTSFDLPKLKEFGVPLDYETHIDGMLLAKMLFPDHHSHSLANMAKHLFPHDEEIRKQVVHEKEWYDTCSDEDLAVYCAIDLKVTWKVVEKLLSIANEREKGHCLKVEERVRELMDEQAAHGVAFDAYAADKGVMQLKNWIGVLEGIIAPQLPVLPIPPNKLHYPPKKQFKQDGTPSELIKKYVAKYGLDIDLISLPVKEPIITAARLETTETARLKQYLLDQGWLPTHWNHKKDKSTGKRTKSSPRLTNPTTKEPCPNLKKVNAPWVGDFSTLLMYKSRRNILYSPKGTGLIPTAIANGGLIRADADTLGANTARFIHKGVVNIPRVGSFFGEEMRSYFIARKDKVMVGWDATALEGCMEAHYCYNYDPAYAKTLTEGNSEDGTDIHTVNMKALGLKNRDDAKTFKYAISYGAKPARLAQSLGVDLPTAEKWYDDFWKTNPGLTKLKSSVEAEWQVNGKKAILGLDGRLIRTRSQHSLINAKFQSAGAIVMKHAMIIAHKAIKEQYGDRANAVIRMHDEEQWECDKEIAGNVGRIGEESVRLAGEYLQLNVPLKAVYKVGKSWADTH